MRVRSLLVGVFLILGGACGDSGVSGDHHNDSVRTPTPTPTATSTVKPGSARLVVSPSSFDFSVVTTGDSANQVFTVTNDGFVPATGMTFSSPSAPFSIQFNSCGGTLAAGSNCTIGSRFAPSAVKSFSVTLTISYQDGSGTSVLHVVLSGEGTNVIATPTATPTRTPTPTPTSTASPTPTETPISGSDLVIYDDSLAPGWNTSSSWSVSSVTLASTEQVYQGNFSIKFVSSATWGALAVQNSSLLDPALYSAFEFQIRIASVSQQILVDIYNGETFLNQRDLGTVTANSWQKISIPMATLNPGSAQFDRLAILTNTASGTYFVDNMRLVSSGSNPTPTPTPTSTPTPTPTATPTGPTPTPTPTGTPGGTNIWITAYLESWNLNVSGREATLDSKVGVPIPIGNIDWNAFTHLAFFAVGLTSDGTAIDHTDNWSDERVQAIVPAAHGGNSQGVQRPIIFTIGGEGGSTSYIGSDTSRRAAVQTIINYMNQKGFDGVDIDMEPIDDTLGYVAFITLLRSEFDKMVPWYRGGVKCPVLTAAVMDNQDVEGTSTPLFKYLENKFDQINVMSYDMGGYGSPDWSVSWHNAALYVADGNGNVFPADAGINSEGMSVAIQKKVTEKIMNRGSTPIAKTKLGLGMSFHGHLWSSSSKCFTSPRQPSSGGSLTYTSYSEIRVNYIDKLSSFPGAQVIFESNEFVPYVSIPSASNSNCHFISYQDERTLTELVKFARGNSTSHPGTPWGGIIIYDLGEGYLPANYAVRDPLLQAVKAAAFP
ncbi:MAG: glycosyl hydrolase family 18 protein [Pseudomonadota bacterium]